jgi:hypothetical protein
MGLMSAGAAQNARDTKRVLRSLHAFSLIGVAAAVVIAIMANVLVARFYKRWDWTSAGLYTLSQATHDTLRELKDPVEVIVFLSASDPLTLSVRHMLSAYGAETRFLRARYVDPDKNPAEFLALQQKYKLLAGKSEDGRVVTDASMVVARGERHWFVTTDDIVTYDEEDGRARPKLEQALTEGIRNVLERERSKICFTTGHQEISIDDGGPTGLAEFRYRLEKNNYAVELLDLTTPGKQAPLEPCRVVVVAGPEVEFAPKPAARIVQYLTAGGSVMLIANPVLDEENRIRPTGLDVISRAAGIQFNADFVIEQDEASRMPTGLGETFFATPVLHDITKGLFKDGEKIEFKVMLSAAQSLRALPDRTAATLLKTSASAFSLRDIRPFVEEGKPVRKGATDAQGPFSLALAAELPKPAGSKEKHGPRLVAVGSANVAWGRNWRETTLLGTRQFMESAMSWLAARPAIVSVPPKASHDVGLNLTEESLGEVLRYVLIYMPGAAALLGGFLMYRRRATERRSRRASKKADGSSGAGSPATPPPGSSASRSESTKTDEQR